jgi:hypothetical protein
MDTVNFKTSSYFPLTAIIVAAIVMIPVAIILLFSTLVILGLITLLAGVVILTTHYRLEIDFQKKTFHDYVSFLFFFKSGETGRFESIHYLFVKSKKVSQTVNSRVSSMTVHKEVFDGYLKFSDDEKIHLDTKDTKEALLKKLTPISNQLRIRIIDYTAGDPKVIHDGNKEG